VIWYFIETPKEKRLFAKRTDGQLILRDGFSGVFLGISPTVIAENPEDHGRVCFLLANIAKFFWFQSFLKGVFEKPVGIKTWTLWGFVQVSTCPKFENPQPHYVSQ